MFSVETWKFINTFAPWLSAIGTISAVILSLHFAKRDKNVRLEIGVGHRLIVTPGVPGPYPEYLLIHIVNIGHRDAQVINIGWKVGIFKKQLAIQTTINDRLSSSLPIRLKDGEEAKYFIRLDQEDDFLKDFISKMLMPFPRLQCHFAKIQVFTSIGNVFESRMENNLKKKIIEKHYGK